MLSVRLGFNNNQKNNVPKENNAFTKNKKNKQNINFASSIRFLKSEEMFKVLDNPKIKHQYEMWHAKKNEANKRISC